MTNDGDGIDADVCVWFVDLDSAASQIRLCERILDEDELARANRFHFRIHRDRYVTCRAALRRILAHKIDAHPAAVRFSYGKFGKPELKDNRLGLRFNVSHAGSRAVIAVTRRVEVGIDIEPLRAVDEPQQLAGLVFSDDELTQLDRMDDKCRAFLNGWTRKEAYIKALGTGLSEPLRHVSVSLGERAELLATGPGGGTLSDWTLVELTDPGHVVAVAARVAHATVRVHSALSLPNSRR